MSGETPLRILEKSPSKRSQRNFKLVLRLKICSSMMRTNFLAAMWSHGLSMDINEVPYVYSTVQVLSYLFDMGNMETSRMASWIFDRDLSLQSLQWQTESIKRSIYTNGFNMEGNSVQKWKRGPKRLRLIWWKVHGFLIYSLETG